jgi:hypothetical protein
VVLDISKEIVKVEGDYQRTRKAAELALTCLQKAYDNNELPHDEKELVWLNNLAETVAELPDDVSEFIGSVINDCDKLDPKKYDL